MRIAAALASLAPLLPYSCGASEEETAVPKRPSNEQALQLIHSCHVESIIFAHDLRVFLTLRDGRTVVVARPARTALADAAENVAGSDRCDIGIGLE